MTLDLLPAAWLPDCTMTRVHIHWTGGTHTPNSVDLAHYHVLIDGAGKPVKGKPSIALNSGWCKIGYAEHTYHANTNAIGISVCAMAGAREAPFDAGSHPITAPQWDAMIRAVAQLAKRYGIAITTRTILTHAEVQVNLGIPQRQKWDITRGVPGRPEIIGARAVGDFIRAAVASALREDEPTLPFPPTDQVPASRVVAVTADSLNFRRAPNGEDIGDVPRGTRLVVLGTDGAWLQVRTPAGYVGWVHGAYVEPVGLAPA
jgi:hypothetical protein